MKLIKDTTLFDLVSEQQGEHACTDTDIRAQTQRRTHSYTHTQYSMHRLLARNITQQHTQYCTFMHGPTHKHALVCCAKLPRGLCQHASDAERSVVVVARPPPRLLTSPALASWCSAHSTASPPRPTSSAASARQWEARGRRQLLGFHFWPHRLILRVVDLKRREPHGSGIMFCFVNQVEWLGLRVLGGPSLCEVPFARQWIARDEFWLHALLTCSLASGRLQWRDCAQHCSSAHDKKTSFVALQICLLKLVFARWSGRNVSGRTLSCECHFPQKPVHGTFGLAL